LPLGIFGTCNVFTSSPMIFRSLEN